MKFIFYVGTLVAVVLLNLASPAVVAQMKADTPPEHLFIDVHHLGPGKVTAEAVAGAHAKDLAVEGKYGVHFLQYWVDEAGGNVYCLSSTADSNAIRQTHAEAHGLLPDEIYRVTGTLPPKGTSPLHIRRTWP